MDIEIQRGGAIRRKKERYRSFRNYSYNTLFSPIQKVLFEISETRVAQRSDYEKLTLEIWTDGSISPEDALAQAAKILKEHLTIFINFEEEVEEEVDELDELTRN